VKKKFALAGVVLTSTGGGSSGWTERMFPMVLA